MLDHFVLPQKKRLSSANESKTKSFGTKKRTKMIFETLAFFLVDGQTPTFFLRPDSKLCVDKSLNYTANRASRKKRTHGEKKLNREFHA